MPSETPTLIFGMPAVAGLADLVEESLFSQDFNVISLPKLAKSSGRYPSLPARLYAKYRKILRGDKDIAMEMKGRVLQKKLLALLGPNQADYALLMSADIYSMDLLRLIKEKTRLSCVNYQFDGLHRFPKIYERIGLFDRFYVFDENDLQVGGEHVETATNFYFPHLYRDLPLPQYDFYFTATHNPSRQKHIADFADWALSQGYSLDFTIIGKNIRDQYPSAVRISKDFIPFRDNLLRARESRVLVDFVIDAHQGLSFRTFEALGMGKKLITTNAEIKKYDFYHPDNVFVWDGENLDSLKAFLARPYHPMPSETVEKYAFDHWVKRVLNTPIRIVPDHE